MTKKVISDVKCRGLDGSLDRNAYKMNEKRTFKATVKKASNQSPGSDYCDTFGIFAGLQEDNKWSARLLEGYAWCAGKNILILSTIFSYMHINLSI